MVCVMKLAGMIDCGAAEEDKIVAFQQEIDILEPDLLRVAIAEIEQIARKLPMLHIV